VAGIDPDHSILDVAHADITCRCTLPLDPLIICLPWSPGFASWCGTPWYGRQTVAMTPPRRQSADVSVRQFVADSGSVTRGLRQGHAYTLTLNGEPLARMIPIRRRQAIPKDEVLAIFATAPVIDVDELRSDLDASVAQDLRDPYEGTDL